MTMVIKAICLLTEKKIYKFKANNKNVNFPYQFCQASMPNKFDYVEAEEVTVKDV